MYDIWRFFSPRRYSFDYRTLIIKLFASGFIENFKMDWRPLVTRICRSRFTVGTDLRRRGLIFDSLINLRHNIVLDNVNYTIRVLRYFFHSITGLGLSIL